MWPWSKIRSLKQELEQAQRVMKTTHEYQSKRIEELTTQLKSVTTEYHAIRELHESACQHRDKAQLQVREGQEVIDKLQSDIVSLKASLAHHEDMTNAKMQRVHEVPLDGGGGSVELLDQRVTLDGEGWDIPYDPNNHDTGQR